MRVPLVELEADHPGFNDPAYRQRRDEIARIANECDETPRDVEYTPTEVATWRTVHDKLVELYPTHACREYNAVLAELDYRSESIPQLSGVSRFLESRTGFRLRPVAGLVSAREFLGALADRVFCSTQYIRHHSQPHYTPEPDIVHELMGHAPMLAVDEFAELSQKIGEGSRGAPDATIEQLATLYWYTIEYGVVRQEDGLRAYGAGLLSSFGELEHALSGKVEIRTFEPEVAKDTPYPITRFQPLLWSVGSIREAFARMAAFVGDGPAPGAG
jgi:phenylalanine-4-hydroxylase